MGYTRENTRRIQVGCIVIGGGAPVVIQSMINTDIYDIDATCTQIERLAEVGCEIVRCTILNMRALKAFRIIIARSSLPVIADIHFNVKLAIAAVENGAAALRINPGNINNGRDIDILVSAAKAHKVPIRVGVNSGSLPRNFLDIYGRATPRAIVKAAFRYIRLLEERNFYNIKISLKSSNVLDTIAAYRYFAELSNYPLHLGVTEAGNLLTGSIKSAIGIGSLLLEGLGDTLRVSLAADPVKEVQAAWNILRACGLRRRGVEIIACPTCGRTKIDIISLLKTAEKALIDIQAPLTLAIMGCIVNGPGEAYQADVGIAGGQRYGVIFSKGRIIKKLPESDLLNTFIEEVRRIEEEYFQKIII